MMKVPIKRIDYVKLYAEKMKKDNSVFKQQAALINSQLKSSASVFKNMFGKEYKKNARVYLKARGLA